MFGRKFALSAQPLFLSLSSSNKEERAGERRRFLSISPLSGSLPARSSQGERGKMPQAFCVPNTTGWQPAKRQARQPALPLGVAADLRNADSPVCCFADCQSARREAVRDAATQSERLSSNTTDAGWQPALQMRVGRRFRPAPRATPAPLLRTGAQTSFHRITPDVPPQARFLRVIPNPVIE